MLNFEIDSVDELEEPLRGLYEEVDGKYRLKVNGIEDVGPLKRAKDHEKQARKAAEENAKELKDKLEEMNRKIEEKELADKKAAGDDDGWREAMTKSWEGKYTKLEDTLTQQLTKRDAALREILVDKEAMTMAIAISGDDAEVIYPHIRARLDAVEEGERMKTAVLDADGSPSALSVDELTEEFRANKKFASIVIGSRATGGGAAPSKGGGASQNSSGDLSKMNREQKLEHFRNRRGT